MAMLITKFNKLIANKFVWIGFTILIVLAFVAWDMAVPEDARDPSARIAAGTLYGEPVSPDEFQQARIHTYMSLVLSFGQAFPITPEVDEELNNMAWRRLISLRKGKELGLQTSNREVVAAIRNFPGFQHEGQFDSQAYRQFLQQYLNPLGFSDRQFEEHVRQELILQKLERMVTETVLLSPAEVDRAISTIGDEFTVDYALINEKVLGAGLEPTEEEVMAFFETNKSAFMIPPKVQVKFVRFPIASFMEGIEITEDQALAYYDLHLDDFVKETEPDDDGEDLFVITETIPFEDVQADIKATLQRDMAARRAADVAMDFVIALVPDRDGIAQSFEQAAEAFDVAVERVPPFARDEIPDGIDAGLTFARDAFDRRLHPEFYFSDAIEGTDYFYVLALEERIPEREPLFEEVEIRVREAATEAAIADALRDLADHFRSAAQELIEAGDSFSAAAEPFAIPVQEAVAFSAAEGLEDVPYGNDLVRSVLNYNQGEVTEPVRLIDGYLVAHVALRTPADPAQFAAFRPQIIASLTRERGRILFEEWQEQLLRDANFTPRTLDRFDYDEDFEDDDWANL